MRRRKSAEEQEQVEEAVAVVGEQVSATTDSVLREVLAGVEAIRPGSTGNATASSNGPVSLSDMAVHQLEGQRMGIDRPHWRGYGEKALPFAVDEVAALKVKMSAKLDRVRARVKAKDGGDGEQDQVLDHRGVSAVDAVYRHTPRARTRPNRSAKRYHLSFR